MFCGRIAPLPVATVLYAMSVASFVACGAGWHEPHGSALVRHRLLLTWFRWAPPPATNTVAVGATTGGAAACLASPPGPSGLPSVPWHEVHDAARPFEW